MLRLTFVANVTDLYTSALKNMNVEWLSRCLFIGFLSVRQGFKLFPHHLEITLKASKSPLSSGIFRLMHYMLKVVTFYHLHSGNGLDLGAEISHISKNFQ